MNIIELKSVSRRYGSNVLALDNVTLSVPKGCVMGLLGRNGAGKSTMIRIIMAMIHQTSGEVSVFGKDPWQDHEGVKSRIGYMSEDQILPPYLTVQDVFGFFGECYRTWDMAAAEQMRKRFGLDVGRKIGRMSKGEKRQVGLICAVAHNPELLVLDEPAGGLDVVARREFLEIVIELLHERGATVFYSSHQLNDVERISDRVALLNNGKLEMEGELDHLHENYCRVVLPENIVGGKEALAVMPDCISASPAGGGWQAVFNTGVERARELTMPLLKDPAQFQATPLNLEEIFIALVGDQNHESID